MFFDRNNLLRRKTRHGEKSIIEFPRLAKIEKYPKNFVVFFRYNNFKLDLFHTQNFICNFNPLYQFNHSGFIGVQRSADKIRKLIFDQNWVLAFILSSIFLHWKAIMFQIDWVIGSWKFCVIALFDFWNCVLLHVNSVSLPRTDHSILKQYHKNEWHLCLVRHSFTKLSQNISLINVTASHGPFLAFIAVFWVFSYISVYYSCLNDFIFTKLSQIVLHLTPEIIVFSFVYNYELFTS